MRSGHHVGEVLLGPERRRRWTLEEKLRCVAESEQPGARTTDIARRYGVSRGLLFTWRRQKRRGSLTATPGAPTFVPVRVVAEPAQGVEYPDTTRPRRVSGAIEIVFTDGVRIRIDADVEGGGLRAVLAALGRR